MKRFISFCVALTFILTLLVPFAAADSRFTQKQAIDLLDKAFARAGKLIIGYNDDHLSDDKLGEYLMYDDLTVSSEHDYGSVTFDTSVSGDKYPEPITYVYLLGFRYTEDGDRIFERITSEFLNKYISDCFTEDMRDRYFTKTQAWVYDEQSNRYIEVEADMFRNEESSGYVLITPDQMENWAAYVVLGYEKGDVVPISFESGSNTARLTVLAYRLFNMFGYAQTIETVDFVKTKSGWRISGGTLFDVAFGGGASSFDQNYSEFELLAINAYAEATILYRNHSDIYLYRQESKSGKKYFVESSMQDLFSKKIYNESTVTYTHSTKGEKYEEPQIYYRTWVGGEYSDSYKRVEEYIDRLSSVMLPSLYEPWMYTDNGAELLRNEYLTGNGILIHKDAFIEGTDDNSIMYYYLFSKYNGVRMLSSKKAKIEVILRQHNAESGLSSYCTTTFEAIKTKDGWRASGGEMFDVIRGDALPEEYVPVPTGDGSQAEVGYLILVLFISALGAFRMRRPERG